MRYLIDTNILSELSKDKPNAAVMTWFSEHLKDELLISAITVGEIAYGLEKKTAGADKDELEDWLESTLLEWFEGAIVPIDSEVMVIWARLCASTRTLPVLDSLIAASALNAQAHLVTRNTKDFAGIEGLVTINPWEE